MIIALQHFLAHNEDGSKREPAWSNDLLTYDGKNAAVLFLEWLAGGAQGYKTTGRGGRKPSATLVSAL